jgi:hypothetical protein
MLVIEFPLPREPGRAASYMPHQYFSNFLTTSLYRCPDRVPAASA